MVEGNLATTLSIMVPVMFLVVVELAGVARGIDLRENLPEHIDRENRPWVERRIETVIHYLPGIKSDETIPTWGHFGTIHSFNVVILLYGLISVNYGMTGTARFVLSFGVAIMLALLPLIEIDEYSDLKTTRLISSFRVNFWGMLILTPSAGIIGSAYAEGTPLVILAPYTVGVVIFFGFVLAYFGVFLRREIETLAAQD